VDASSIHDLEESIVRAVTTIGIDIVKSVFQVHGIDPENNVTIHRQLKRRYVTFFQKLPPCLVSKPAIALLVARTQGTRPLRAPDAARQALSSPEGLQRRRSAMPRQRRTWITPQFIG
jgi:hypothetical protein